MPKIKIEEERVLGKRSFSESILLDKEPYGSLACAEYNTHYGVVRLTIGTNPEGIREARLTWEKEIEILSKILASPDATLTVPLGQNGIWSKEISNGPASRIITLYP